VCGVELPVDNDTAVEVLDGAVLNPGELQQRLAGRPVVLGDRPVVHRVEVSLADRDSLVGIEGVVGPDSRAVQRRDVLGINLRISSAVWLCREC